MGFSNKLILRKILFVIFGLCFAFMECFGQELTTIADLNGEWKFSIGDNLEWSNINFNDEDWNEIRVPGSWESQGYYGYDGIAWYRKKVNVPSEFNNQNLYLDLGYIDDVDEVYLNGVKIGATGGFPPQYKTAYNAKRLYLLPKRLIKQNSENLIAVRVFDEQLEGGIIRGNTRLLREKHPLQLDMDLQGLWKFKTGDDLQWSNLNNYSDWDEIIVPGTWENQGYHNYDGFAWYVIQIEPGIELISNKLVLVLGKIDDIDELYINGKLVAATGRLEKGFNDIVVSTEYNEFRGYYLPDNIFEPNKINTIAVRVYDARVHGGIYKGPVGIVTQEKYIRYWRDKKESR